MVEGNSSSHLVKSSLRGSPAVLTNEEDISLAALVDVPVLISGPAGASCELACELDRRSSTPMGAVEVIDCRVQDALRSLESGKEASAAEQAKILLLQEVHALSPDDQLRLTRKLEEIGQPPTCRRILASSSVPLFDRVVDHLFSEPLYYRLNVIHIVISPNYRD